MESVLGAGERALRQPVEAAGASSMRVVRARCCARNLRSRNGARRLLQLYQVNQRANIDVGSCLETHLGAPVGPGEGMDNLL